MVYYMDNNNAREDNNIEFSKLPQKWQEAYRWFMNNFDSIVVICEILDLTETERAIETENCELMLFLELEVIVNYEKLSQTEGRGLPSLQ